MHTDYFVADHEGLSSAFAGWLTVGSEPVIRESRNPFTGAIKRMEEWSTQGPISDGVPAEFPDLAPLPHVLLKRIEHAKVASLAGLVTRRPPAEVLQSMLKPALIHPTNEDVGLHAVPADVVSALAALQDNDIEAIAAKWQETDETRDGQFHLQDCCDVLRSLGGLSRAAAPQRQMYLLWSL
jgi:hypothetical protein